MISVEKTYHTAGKNSELPTSTYTHILKSQKIKPCLSITYDRLKTKQPQNKCMWKLRMMIDLNAQFI